MQDASFITSDPGHAKSDTPRGEDAKTRWNEDGTWGKDGTKSYFGYKPHGAMNENFGLIRRAEVTTSKVHDSQADLANEDEVRYADKRYFGAKTKWYDAVMRKATKGHSLSYKNEMRNKRISSKRSPLLNGISHSQRESARRGTLRLLLSVGFE